MRYAWMLTIALLTAGAVSAAAQSPSPGPQDTTGAPSRPPAEPERQYPSGRISGLVFGDAYYNLAGNPRHAYSESGADSGRASIDASGQPITRDLNGVQIRRIYFQLDNDLSRRVSARFRLEADSRAFTSDGKIGVFVKNAYLQVRDVIARGDLHFGLVNTPSWEFPEEVWAYRAVEKTIVDFRGLSSASDLGVALKGHLDAAERFGYVLMVGNGQFQRPENNRYKRFYFSLPVKVGVGRLEPYVDYEHGASGEDRATYKLFAGYERDNAALGAELVDRVNHFADGKTEPRGVSIFARWSRSEKLGVFARYDVWQADKRADDRVDSDLWMAGVDWQPFKDVHVIPNLEGTQYRAQGAAVAPAHHDLQARVTVYYRFSRPQS